VGVIARVRALAVGIAKAWVDQQKGDEEKRPSSDDKIDDAEPVPHMKVRKEKLSPVG
jgi:hypothetical protein